MKYTLAILAIIVLSINTNAQVKNVEPVLSPLKSDDNGMAKEIEILKQQLSVERTKNLELFTQTYITKINKGISSLPDTSCVVTIPMVFHVFHPQGAAGVPLSQIDYAINDLNITFGGKDADYGTVNSAFSAVKSYTKIRFARALIDPKGNPTTGVVYYEDKQSGFGNNTGWDSEIASCAWDNYKYFNVYLMNDLYADNVTNNSGVCWFPSSSMSGNGTARMVYNYTYLGQGGSSFNDLEFNQTFTHECGHYLNLLHTFDGTSCTGVGDYCGDTPPTDIAAAGCTAVRCGGLINGENYMDYNSTCYKNFTMDQNARMEAALAMPSRQPLWQYGNLVATGVLSPVSGNSCVTTTKFFSYSKTNLAEDIINAGAIETPPVIIYACAGAQFALTNATLISGTHYTIMNVPSGLSVSIVTSTDGKSATMTFSGNATSHLSVNSVNNIQLTFTDAAVLGGSVSTINDYTKTFSISFRDPWQKTCETPNILTNSSTTWNKFETTGPIPRYYGLWYNAGSYYLENYGRGIITTSLTSDNIQFLSAGTVISASSPWRMGGSQGVLYSSAYTALNNQTGYVGFRMQAGTDFFYGWMKISVSSISGITLLEYQYNEKPNDPITIGSSCASLAGITENQLADNSFLLFPNPSSGEFSIVLSTDNSEISVTDLLGKEVIKTKTTEKNIKFQLSQNGVYMVTVKTKQGTSTKKLIVNK